MKKLVIIFSAALLVCSTANGQALLRNLGERAKNAVENKIGQNVEKSMSGVVDKAGKKADEKINAKKKGNAEGTAGQAGSDVEGSAGVKPGSDRVSAWTCEECGKAGNTGKFCDDCGAKMPQTAGQAGSDGKSGGTTASVMPGTTTSVMPGTDRASQPKKQTSSNYAKSDFVPGDEIFFEDTFENEQMGEFPAQWDLMSGYAEVGSVDGRKVIAFTDDGFAEIQPLMNDQQHFLPDVFTLEFDMYLQTGDGLGGDELEIAFGNPDLPNWNGRVEYVVVSFRDDGYSRYGWTVQKPNGGDDITGEKLLSLDESGTPLKDGWNHFAFSFNKRAFKGYVNGVRVMSVPTSKVPSHFWFNHGGQYKYACISNVRLAKGAVPLYDRLASEGKIITDAITFEVGKADIKPESMVEINRIAKLMQENPGLEFEVQGHCDASGSDKVNDPLSQKRAEAIVAALVDQGIAGARLTAVGKGSHVPIASNSTDEGRAKNRRVEFVKK